jgi:hypothetical protein
MNFIQVFMTETEPKIDFTKLEFPSDDLTVKMIRRAYPEATDVEFLGIGTRSQDVMYRRRSFDDILGMGLLGAEREIADRAFRAELGQSMKDLGTLFDRRDLIDGLNKEYRRYGLVHGKHETKALVEQIEAQAAAQARQYGRKL